MKDMPANAIRDAAESYRRPPGKMRSQQEILARYNQALMSYRELCFSSGDVHQQKLSTYAEIKVLGWVLGKPEKDIIKDVSENSNRMPFGTF